MCPGYLWGRYFRDDSKISHLNPEHNMSCVPFDESGRFYKNCDRIMYTYRCFWLGGPIAVLVNKTHVKTLLKDFIAQYNISITII